jgi:hypothetical protein
MSYERADQQSAGRPTTRAGRQFTPGEARVRLAVQRLAGLAGRQHDATIYRQRLCRAGLRTDLEDLASDVRDARVMAAVLLRDLEGIEQDIRRDIGRLNDKRTPKVEMRARFAENGG